MKYLERLQQSQEEQEKQESQFQADEAKLSLASDILATSQSVAKGKRELETLKGSFPFDAESIVKKQIELESNEDGLKRLKALEKELF